MNSRRRTGARITALAILLALLPGFPVLLLVIGGVAAMVGHAHLGFQIALTSYNLYLSLPASVFGSRLFPSEEFGYVPTPAGILVASGFYAIIAIALYIAVGRASGIVGASTDAHEDSAVKVSR